MDIVRCTGGTGEIMAACCEREAFSTAKADGFDERSVPGTACEFMVYQVGFRGRMPLYGAIWLRSDGTSRRLPGSDL
jgi:hypothetical protein